MSTKYTHGRAWYEPHEDRTGVATGRGYVAAWRQPNGKVRRSSGPNRGRGFPTIREAVAFAEAQAGVNRVVARKGDGLATYAPLWLADYRDEVTPRTVEVRESNWRIHIEPRWGDYRPADITRREVDAWLADLTNVRTGTPASKAQRKSVRESLQNLLRWCVDDEQCPIDVYPLAAQRRKGSVRRSAAVADITPPKRFMSMAEWETIRALMPDELALAGDFAALAGYRYAEVPAIDVADLTDSTSIYVYRQVNGLATKYLPVKHGHPRHVPYEPELRARVDAHLRRFGITSGPLFMWKGKVATPYVVGYHFRRAAAAAGLGHWTFHDLRHHFGSVWAKAHGLEATRQAMGHADVRTTVIYAHAVGYSDADLAAVEAVRREHRVTSASQRHLRVVN